jgi:hypothetical protein
MGGNLQSVIDPKSTLLRGHTVYGVDLHHIRHIAGATKLIQDGTNHLNHPIHLVGQTKGDDIVIFEQHIYVIAYGAAHPTAGDMANHGAVRYPRFFQAFKDFSKFYGVRKDFDSFDGVHGDK